MNTNKIFIFIYLIFIYYKKQIQIVIDALKIQPCNPSFLEARDAIVLAQKQRFNDKDLHCAIWKGFAKRGMGINAQPPSQSGDEFLYIDNYDVPTECM